MIKVLGIFLFLAVINSAFSQDSAFVSVPNCPCPEVYNLLKDREGYIWMAHDFGVSRYDGRNFVSFSNPGENALAVTDLTEDNYKRIWCHNFAGQIFYVEHFQLHLLTAYKFADEATYPRIGLCGDDLVATSSKGLFVLDTKTMASRYYLFKSGTNTLTVLNNKVLLYGSGRWYLYRPHIGVAELPDGGLHFDKGWNLALQPHGKGDTAYFIHNPDGYYYKLFVKDGHLCLANKISANGFINAITIHDSDVWIHTRSFSIKEGSRDSIIANNLTDVARDDYGNVFISSLKNGLLAHYNSPYIEEVNTFNFRDGDFIRKIVPYRDRFVCGTQAGKILLLSSALRKLKELNIPGRDIPIEILFPLAPDEFIAGTTIGTFWINFNRPEPLLIDKELILKDIIRVGDTIYLATNRDLRSLPAREFIHFDTVTPHPIPYSVIKEGRTRALGEVVDHGRSIVLCSFGDGVYAFSGKIGRQLMYNGLPVYGTKIRQLEQKTIISTFNQGVIVIDNGRMTNLTTRDGLLSNSIKDVKITANGIWIISFSGFLQKMDFDFRLVPTAVTPVKVGAIYDLEEKDSMIFMATNNKFYKATAAPGSIARGSTAVDYILVNGKDSAVGEHSFRHEENNLQINLSTPFFNQYYFLRYKYRFRDKAKTNLPWAISDDEQKAFSLSGLPPGHYVFEAEAINPIGEAIASPVIQAIDIIPAWYQTAWFAAASILLGFLVIFYVMRVFFLYRLREQRSKLEREIAVERERRRIAADLHDDIGSTLSSINIYTGMAKKAANKEFYFDSISQNVNSVIDKLDDLVWSINPRYDTLGDIANRLMTYAAPLAKVGEIEIQVEMAGHVKSIKPPQETKHHLYLMVKELINNAIKHSRCKSIHLCFDSGPDSLVVTVRDDGTGFLAGELNKGRNGLANITQRMNELKGEVVISVAEGTAVVLTIPW
jgi:signal transduction histidine kinase